MMTTKFDDDQTPDTSPQSDSASTAPDVDEVERLAAALMEALARRQAAGLAAKPSNGVDAALDRLGSRLAPAQRAAVRDVLLRSASPAAFEMSDQCHDEISQTPDNQGDCDDCRSDEPAFQRLTKARTSPRSRT